MAKALGLLQSLGTVINSTLPSGRAFLGTWRMDAPVSQVGLAARLLSTLLSTPAAGTAPVPRAEVANATASNAPGSSAQAEDQSSSSTSGSPAADAVFNMGFRRVVTGRRGALGGLEGIIHVQNTLNNIILTLTDKSGAIKAYTSAGVVGFRGSRKSQPIAAEKAAEELAKRALKLGYSTVEVRLKGPGSNKQYAVQSLAGSGLQISSLADVTPIPYNGCRPPKRRRV